MRCVIAVASLVAAFGSGSIGAAEELHEKWMDFYIGEWTYEWKGDEGDFAEKGAIVWTKQARGKAIVGRIRTEAGDNEIEVFGWDPAKKVPVAASVQDDTRCNFA